MYLCLYMFPPVLGRGELAAWQSDSRVALYASACCRRAGEVV